ncbi:EF-P lysine aminoacylase EpmA [Methylophaga sp. OBS3]|uniref:EF-P lysine aminoacylase EpmA n=1 Tax=Methylophaga sp. OBS3 TaxID=2991934 RepID=UPI00225BD4BD|nr:EF-P lysine aminoacylase EpmA [Methylophaga sp. OBS3]MCX4188790.1 EF-P lysine aminoacylase EpmA [Methylophaga sp. OBS3]
MLLPSETPALLKKRAALNNAVRSFFAQREVLEVQTPVLSHSAPTAPYLDSFSTAFNQGTSQQPLYLHTSPEFAMKRLLAAGSGAIYQICPVFRNGEAGRVHSPEFTMLEWYRPDFTLEALMDEVDELLQRILDSQPAQRISYQQAFQQTLNIDVFAVPTDTLCQLAMTHIKGVTKEWTNDRDAWLELLMSEIVEPTFVQGKSPVMVYDFPVSQAQLAKTYQNSQCEQVAARFEVYVGGVELANGYDELLDAEVLAKRFERDNQYREEQGLPVMPIDHNLLASMQQGLPACSGVALGLDRLFMLQLGKSAIDEVTPIRFDNA